MSDKISKLQNYKRKFTQLSRAWYGEANLKNTEFADKIRIGYYHEDGSTPGEFQVVWEKTGDRIVPQLIVFDDGWAALFNCGDILEKMADMDNKKVTPDEFCKMLVELGLEDNTKTEDESENIDYIGHERPDTSCFSPR